MSKQHPIIAVTGSSGAGTSSAKATFEQLFRRDAIKAAMIEGDCFHRYGREAMEAHASAAKAAGGKMTHFGPEGNLFHELEALFKEYSAHGTGRRRYYIHDEQESLAHGMPPGSLTPWEALPEDTDLLFYEGLHGGLVSAEVDIAQYVDLLIGVAPSINLEWMQKIHRDKDVRGYSAEDAANMILARMPDYVHYITPQFSRTDINFQRIPTVDTANPFGAVAIPAADESFTIIHIRNREKIKADYPYLLHMLGGSFMSRPYTLVVPSGKTDFAMQLLIQPLIRRLMEEKRRGS